MLDQFWVQDGGWGQETASSGGRRLAGGYVGLLALLATSDVRKGACLTGGRESSRVLRGFVVNLATMCKYRSYFVRACEHEYAQIRIVRHRRGISGMQS